MEVRALFQQLGQPCQWSKMVCLAILSSCHCAPRQKWLKITVVNDLFIYHLHIAAQKLKRLYHQSTGFRGFCTIVYYWLALRVHLNIAICNLEAKVGCGTVNTLTGYDETHRVKAHVHASLQSCPEVLLKYCHKMEYSDKQNSIVPMSDAT